MIFPEDCPIFTPKIDPPPGMRKINDTYTFSTLYDIKPYSFITFIPQKVYIADRKLIYTS